MRGPSASHCAAAARIGRLARDLMDGDPRSVSIEFDPRGSLATTHADQGSDMGLFAGLLGWREDDERLPRAETALREAGIGVEIRITPFDAPHPNTYRLTLTGRHGSRTLTALSTGGGAIEIIDVDGASVSMDGGCYETLLFTAGTPPDIPSPGDIADTVFETGFRRGNGTSFLEIKSSAPLPGDLIASLKRAQEAAGVRVLSPVLPVLSRPGVTVPFLTCADMLAFNRDRGLALWELAAEYESARGGMSTADVVARMEELVAVMERAIETGLGGTVYGDRILAAQSPGFARQLKDGRLLDAGMLNRMILYVTAIMEVKSSMGVVVAAPTAGSCGGLPGAVIAASRSLGYGTDETVQAMLAAGMIGIFIAAHSTFAAEVCGCQAECGAGSGMAAAALAALAGSGAKQAAAAASIALQNIMGMVCDPVANRVEVPCLGKNVMAAANALAAANMALAGYDPVIPLDEVIAAMDSAGRSLPMELRCTALGGLSVTGTSKAIERTLKKG
ncbi:L-serine ammonia-lyase, iron-sulfur-dependent, subunit alpha [bacterium]|nr:L-serine ammonia-lyase, iron-sulfur-dependent, subunit alpha [bacterium]